MKVALTGVSGMVGRHMVELLAKEEIACIATSRNQPENFLKDFTWFPWNLVQWKSLDELDRLFPKCEALIHLGAIVPRKGTYLSDKDILDANVRSCLCLGKWALKAKTPFIFISGGCVYTHQDREDIVESDETGFNELGGFYGYSKLLGEEVLQYLRAKGLMLSIVRPSSIYGFGLAEEKMISKFFLQASRGETIELAPPVNDSIDLIHAADVAQAILMLLQSRKQGVFNIASGTLSTIFDIAKTCVEAVGKGMVEIANDEAKGNRKIRFNLSCHEAKKAFGFSPQYNLSRGIKKMWDDTLLSKNEQ